MYLLYYKVVFKLAILLQNCSRQCHDTLCPRTMAPRHSEKQFKKRDTHHNGTRYCSAECCWCKVSQISPLCWVSLYWVSLCWVVLRQGPPWAVIQNTILFVSPKSATASKAPVDTCSMTVTVTDSFCWNFLPIYWNLKSYRNMLFLALTQKICNS
jgi:hypothetical protein